MLTRKQTLYLEILDRLLPFLRNIQTHSGWRRFRYGSFYPETELVHNLPRLLTIPEFTEYNVHWLNSQARIFAKEGNNPVHGFYDPIMETIAELFSLVPEPLRGKLRWEGPRSVKKISK